MAVDSAVRATQEAQRLAETQEEGTSSFSSSRVRTKAEERIIQRLESLAMMRMAMDTPTSRTKSRPGEISHEDLQVKANRLPGTPS